MSELLRTIERALRRQPSGLAFQCGAETITWAELDQRADHVAHALGAQGLRPGDRVACGLGASVELPVRLLAHLRAGLIHVPVNDRYRQAEIDHSLRSRRRRLVWGSTARQSQSRSQATPQTRL